MKRMIFAIVFVTLIAFLTSCAGLTRTQQKTLTGAAIGAGGGAILGEIVGGRPFTGAVIGAGVGALGGYIAGESDEGYYHRQYRR
jgi:osmotically inducible lipoprotein OsmB